MDTAARFSSPRGVVAAPLAEAARASTLYVADSSNNRIRAIDLASSAKTVSTIAGSGFNGGFANGKGTAAKFDGPTGLAVSGDTLYVTDFGNHRIRAIDLATKVVTTIAGNGNTGSANGIGTNAPIESTVGITASGNMLYVTTKAGLIRKIEYREVD